VKSSCHLPLLSEVAVAVPGLLCVLGVFVEVGCGAHLRTLRNASSGGGTCMMNNHGGIEDISNIVLNGPHSVDDWSPCLQVHDDGFGSIHVCMSCMSVFSSLDC